MPKHLIVPRYFAAEQAAVHALQSELEQIESTLEELKDEHGGDEGALSDVSGKAEATAAYDKARVQAWNARDYDACGH